MSRIFISHSSANNAAALAMGKWLSDNGWDDHFLDVSPARGLAPGERWQEALKAAADRCEAVLFLITPAWRDSRWCLAEFLLAKQLGKKIFGVLMEATPLETLPPEMTVEWQLCDLATGADRESFRVSLDPVVPETEVSFASGGLDQLKRGLRKAGLDASTFQWPPKNDPERSPYPGLRALEAEDAAVFFGRDAAIVRGLDALRGLRERGVERMLVVLGASGAGKSSFLRAGLWPRLARDDHRFLPLPVIRPERAAINGAAGLAASLDQAFRDQGAPRNRADIRKVLQEPGGLTQLLIELQARARPGTRSEEPPPTVVLAIDQGEELFGAEGRTEAEQLLARLAETLAAPETEDAEAIAARRRALAIVAMRSDSYERLQTEPRLAQVRPQLLDLPPIGRTQYKSVIEGPSVRATAAGRKLEVDPDLTERLLEDTEGADALPLLAFTLERLFVEHGADGDLKLDEYEELGGVRGSIEAAINAAFSDPGRAPVIPSDPSERFRCLREGFIPWLAVVDLETNERKRRVAEWDEIPETARPLFERLVEARLLKLDRRRVAGVEEKTAVLEIAHEALLRQWPMLTSWLDEDADSLTAVDGVQRAAEAWVRNRKGAEWLIHTGERLVTAEALRSRADFKRLLGDEGKSYLRACRKREEEIRHRERRQLRRTRLALAATVVFAAATLVGLRSVVQEQRNTLKALARSEFQTAVRELADGQGTRALAHLGRTLQLSPEHEGARHAVVSLLTAAPLIDAELLHAGEVNSAAFSPDGSLVATASFDGTARVWEATTGQPVGEPMRHEGFVRSASFSPDGTGVVTASDDGTARVWEVTTSQPVGEPMRHGDTVNSASFSPDGTWVVTASDDGTARVWEATTGQPVGEPMRHEGFVRSASFSPDGTRVVTASADMTARVWEATTGQPVGEPMRHEGFVRSASFSPDGIWVVTASWDHTARVWEATTGQPVGESLHHEAQVLSASFSPDGSRVVTASADKTARVWEAATGQPVGVHMRHDGYVNSVSFSPDGTRVVTASWDQTARVWEATTGQPVGEPMRHHDAVLFASFSPDGTLAVTASWDHTARVWEATTSQPVGEPLRHEGHVKFASFSPDGIWVVTASWDQTARVWEASTGQPIGEPMRHDGYVNSASFSPDGTLVVTASDDETAQVWDAATGQPIGEPLRHGDTVNSVSFSPDGTQVVTASEDGTAQVWEATTGQPVGEPMRHEKAVNSASFSLGGTWVVTASWDHTARVWEATTGQPIGEPIRHEGGVNSASFSPDGTRVVTASEDGTARVWGATTGQPVGEPMRHKEAVNSASFSPDGTRVVTASWDETAQVWEATTGQPVGEPMRHGMGVNSASFSPDGTRVVTASWDETARVWEATTGQPVGEPMRHEDRVNSASISLDGSRVVTASNDETARVWDVFGGDPGYADFLASLAEAFARNRINDRGALVALADGNERLQDLRRQAEELPDDGSPIALLARWLFGDPWTRTISPLSKMTVPEYICDCLRHDAYDEARRAFPGHPLLSGGPDVPLPAECAENKP